MRSWIVSLLLLTTVALAPGLPGCRGGGGDAADVPEPASEAPPTPTHSMLLITLDTLRADRLGCYGQSQGATPHLDALAADGVMFRRAFAHTPLTIPSHVTIFTGQYPDRHGVRDNGDHFLADEAVTLAERYSAAGYRTAASVAAYVTNHKWGFGQGFDAYFDHIDANFAQGNTWRAQRRGDEVVADLAGWIEADPERPFFAWLHLYDPHDPYDPPEPWASRYPDQPYLGEVGYTDEQVGVLIDELVAQGLDEQTHVVVVGDHGEAFGNHGEWHHGIFVYNATMHVPFLIRPAGGLEQPVVIEEPVGLVDVAPTVLALSGIPAGDPAQFDGVDLSPALQGTEPERRTLYGESLYVRRHFGWSEQRMALRWPHKYIGTTRPELFDIEDDPPENRDVQAEQGDVAASLAAWLDARAPAESAATGAVDPDMARRLEALGYLTTAVDTGGATLLPDPKDKIDVLRDTQRANALTRAGRHAEARALLEKVVADEPELIDARASLATVCANEGDFAAAHVQLDAALSLSPRSTNVIGMKAAVLIAEGRVDEALARLEEALQIDPRQGRIWDQVLRSLFETRRYGELLEATDRALAEIPEAPFVHGYRGAALVALGRLDDARPELDRALAGGQEPPWAHFSMGILEDADGDHESSLNHFLAEYNAYPEHNEALSAAVVQMLRTGRNQEAIEHAAISLARNSSQPRMHWADAQAQFNLGDYDAAAAGVQRCLALAPEDADCVLLQANVLSRQGRTEEAEATFQRAVILAREQNPEAQVEGLRRQ